MVKICDGIFVRADGRVITCIEPARHADAHRCGAETWARSDDHAAIVVPRGRATQVLLSPAAERVLALWRPRRPRAETIRCMIASMSWWARRPQLELVDGRIGGGK